MKVSNLAILTFLVSASAFASNTDTVKALYNAGTAPAAATDFPERNYNDGSYVSAPAIACSIIDGTDQPYGYDISRKIRATPANGPLVPAKSEEKLVFGDTSSSYELVSDPVITATDLVLSNPIYRVWIDNTTGVKHIVPAQLLARQSGNYVAFMISIPHHSPVIEDEVYYGYCYPTGKPLF
jgi:hypothetical protein